MSKKTIIINSSRLTGGSLTISGYKHSMVQIIAASVAWNQPVRIQNVPLVDDTFVLKEIIERCGGRVTLEGHILSIDPREMHTHEIDPELSQKIHGSLYLLPAFNVRFGASRCGETGGCQIGNRSERGRRPIAHMFDVMSSFGYESVVLEDAVIGKRVREEKDVSLDVMNFSDDEGVATSPHISGATKTAILCSIGADKTEIANPYFKTDVQDLLRFLRACGFHIEASPERIVIERPIASEMGWLSFQLTECVSEVMTYIAVAVHTGIDLRINLLQVDSIMRGLQLEFELLEKMGVPLRFEENHIEVSKVDRVRRLDIVVTNESIQSDHHPFFALMLLKGDGPSTIREFVWKNRFAYVAELNKLGANMRQEGNSVRIEPSELTIGGQTLNGFDTRTAALTLVSSLTVNETTRIEEFHHLYRGYENLIESLRSLGADLTIYEPVKV